MDGIKVLGDTVQHLVVAPFEVLGGIVKSLAIVPGAWQYFVLERLPGGASFVLQTARTQEKNLLACVPKFAQCSGS